MKPFLIVLFIFVACCNKNNVNSTNKKIEKTETDVFLIGGQSNAVGQGDSSFSPKIIPGTSYQFTNYALQIGNDPYGFGHNQTSHTGSAWPSFEIRYYNLTGHNVCLVPAAVNGSSQVYAADPGVGNWDDLGKLTDTAIARANAAMDALRGNKMNPVLKGILWCQGESDGVSIAYGSIKGIDYNNALIKMIAKFRTNLGSALPFYIYRTGTWGYRYEWGLDSVRYYQEKVASFDPNTKIVFRDAINFAIYGWLQKDSVHYTQTGLNEMGDSSAIYIGNAN